MKFEINDKVKLIAPVSYLKTSDNMPMLRPPDLVAIDEIGEILSIKSPDTVEVKFRSCLLYTSPSPRDAHESRMPSSA